MRIFFYFFTVIICFNGYSQDSTAVNRVRNAYININTYREKGNTLTKKDSLDFLIEGEDTLVLVTEKFLQKLIQGDAKTVRVKYEPKDSLFLETYKNIVFGSKENSNATLKIWKDDIKIFFDTSVPKLHREALMNFAKEISQDIDSLNIRNVKSKKESNYLVYYINNENDIDYEPRITNKYSGYYVNWNGKQELTHASVKISAMNIKSQEYQISYLKNNFIKTLGYFGNVDSVKCNSYFSKCSGIKNLTSNDLEVIKYHYSYGICKGTNREDFEEIHRKMKKTLKMHPGAYLFIVHTL